MVRGPWEIMGPSVPSQTPEGIRQRYIRSSIVITLILGGILAVTTAVGELAPKLLTAMGFITETFHNKGWPEFIPVAIAVVVPCALVLGVFLLNPLFLVWWEQKVAAHIQIRLGPMRVGGWHGWAQTLADGIKLILKEDITPQGADKWVHFLAPVVVVAPALMCYAPVQFGKGLVAADLDVGVLFILGVSGLSVVGLLMAGWGSNSKYSALGGLRAAAQMVSYEIPRVISILPVVMWAGSLSLSGIAAAQEGYILGGILPRWFIFYPVVGQISFIIYLICSVAETNRTPFDIAEAESELVSGFHTEYSGMKFALFFLGEYAYVFLGSALGTALFLGGSAPLWGFLKFIPSYVWFFGKTLFLVFIFIWIRWTYPRMRVDRLMEFCWKFLFPWSVANVALAGFLILMRTGPVQTEKDVSPMPVSAAPASEVQSPPPAAVK